MKPTVDQLHCRKAIHSARCCVMPRAPRLRVALLHPYFLAACTEFEIDTLPRVAAFLAQLAHESAEWRHFEELATGEDYEGRQDLGNVEFGDGMRFKGRGPIQLTGRRNYRDAGRALGIDLELNPSRASDCDVGFRVAGWYWHTRQLNGFADQGDFDAITRRINGGTNGKKQRDAYHARALAALAGQGVA
jgi:putative chitinase